MSFLCGKRVEYGQKTFAVRFTCGSALVRIVPLSGGIGKLYKQAVSTCQTSSRLTLDKYGNDGANLTMRKA